MTANNTAGAPPPGGSLTPGDILFIVSRHKWKVLIFAVLGFGIAGFVKFRPQKALYESRAKILVRYVSEKRSAIEKIDPGEIKSPDAMGGTLLNTEVEILNSSDVLISAVRQATPQRILAPLGGGTNLND